MESLLLTGAVLAVLLWAALAAYVIHIDRRRTAARAVASAVLTTLRDEGVRSAPIGERVARVQPLLERVSRDMVLHTAADTATPRDSVDVLTTYLVDRWGVYTLVRQASSHRMSRDVWRRTASLKVLFHLGHPQIFDLLTRAVQGRESDIASVA